MAKVRYRGAIVARQILCFAQWSVGKRILPTKPGKRAGGQRGFLGRAPLGSALAGRQIRAPAINFAFQSENRPAWVVVPLNQPANLLVGPAVYLLPHYATPV
jgi:hypothetical protein